MLNALPRTMQSTRWITGLTLIMAIAGCDNSTEVSREVSASAYTLSEAETKSALTSLHSRLEKVDPQQVESIYGSLIGGLNDFSGER